MSNVEVIVLIAFIFTVLSIFGLGLMALNQRTGTSGVAFTFGNAIRKGLASLYRDAKFTLTNPSEKHWHDYRTGKITKEELNALLALPSDKE